MLLLHLKLLMQAMHKTSWKRVPKLQKISEITSKIEDPMRSDGKLSNFVHEFAACIYYQDLTKELRDVICPNDAFQKSKEPHCLLSILFASLCCFIFLLCPLFKPRLRPIPSLGRPRFSPSSKTQALHHFCTFFTIQVEHNIRELKQLNSQFLVKTCTADKIVQILQIIISIIKHPKRGANCQDRN